MHGKSNLVYIRFFVIASVSAILALSVYSYYFAPQREKDARYSEGREAECLDSLEVPISQLPAYCLRYLVTPY